MNLRKSQASGPRPPIALKILLLAIAAGLVAMPGCGGCFSRSNSPAAKAKTKDGKEKTTDEELAELEKKRTKKVEKPKDDFEPLAIRMLPSGDPVLSLNKQQPMLVKPGHWSAVSQIAKANNFDFPGEMVTFVEQTSSNMPLEVENTTSRLGSWCPAILPKGQSKRIESLFYVPRRETQLSGVDSLRSESVSYTQLRAHET
jgi:hypothetical protein